MYFYLILVLIYIYFNWLFGMFVLELLNFMDVNCNSYSVCFDYFKIKVN